MLQGAPTCGLLNAVADGENVSLIKSVNHEMAWSSMTGSELPAKDRAETDDDESIRVLGYEPFRAPEGHTGQGILVRTPRGNIFSLFHPAKTIESAVVWVWGAGGGTSGPADGIFARLAEQLTKDGIASLRVDYRDPNDLYESVMDTLAGVSLLAGIGFKRLALVGHSFGGAVVISAAPYSDKVQAVVGLSSQSAGAQKVADVAPRPLLLVHGTDDKIIPVRAANLIYEWAREPKELKLFEGSGHGLLECKEELDLLLKDWLVDRLEQ